MHPARFIQLVSLLCIVSISRGHFASAQVIFNSTCPVMRAQNNFSLEAYSGLWHEIESYPSLVDEFDICVSLNYTILPGDVLQVRATWFNTSSRRPESIQGLARLLNARREGKLQIDYSASSSNQMITSEGNYWVLETDYINYAIVYLCVPGSRNSSTRFLTYLSRERVPFKAGQDFVRERIRALGLDPRFLKPNDQSSCPLA